MSVVAPTILNFGRIVLNFISFFNRFYDLNKGYRVDSSFSLILLHLEFTLNSSTFFVGSFNIRASRVIYPTEVRRPEINPCLCDMGVRHSQ
jgi:hypothetical protein